MPVSRPARHAAAMPWRPRRVGWGAALGLLMAGLAPAVAGAIVPDCDAAAKALAEARYEHWSNREAQRATVVLSDSVTMTLTTAGEVSFFDVRTVGRQVRQQCDAIPPDANGRWSCPGTERRSVPVSAQPLLDAAALVRRHNARGGSSPEQAAAIILACGKTPIWADVPFNRAQVVMASADGGADVARDICMNGAPFVSRWRNWTHDGGRTWSLQAVIGWCTQVAEPPPAPRPPPALLNELS